MLASAIERLSDGDLPALVYFERILRESVDGFLSLTKQVPRRRLAYSAKAAAFPFLLQALTRAAVDAIDASSATEAVHIRNVLGSRGRIIVTAPAITAVELPMLRSVRPACVYADSMASLQVLLSAADDFHIGLRVNPGVGTYDDPRSSAGAPECRLGIPLRELPAALEVCAEAGVSELALHFHVSCAANSFTYQTVAVRLLQLSLLTSAGRTPRICHLNVGGGVAPPRWDFERDELTWALSGVDALAAEIRQFVTALEGRLTSDFDVWFEPGDALVAPAAVLVTRVCEQRRSADGTRYAMLDASVSHFPHLGLYGETPSVVWPPQDQSGDRFVLAGNSCVTHDEIAVVHGKSNLQRTVFSDRGGYEFARMTFFNGRLRPAVFFLGADEALTCERRDSVRDLQAFWSPPDAVARRPSDHRTWFVVEDGQDFQLTGPDDAEISFPESLAARIIESFSEPGDVVLDPFAGFGTTVAVAQRLNRIGIGVEMNPRRHQFASARVEAPSRMMLGDATLVDELGTGKASLILTAPPYWEPIRDALTAYQQPATPYEAYLRVMSDVLRRLRRVLRPGGTLVLVLQNVAAEAEDAIAKPLVWDIGRVAAERFRFIRDWIACFPWEETDASLYGNHQHCLIFTSPEEQSET